MRRIIAVTAALASATGLALVAGPAAANFVSPTPAANSAVQGSFTVTSDKLDNGSLCINKDKANTTFTMLNSSNAVIINGGNKAADSSGPSWGPYDSHAYPNGSYTLRIEEEKRSGTVFCSNSTATTNRAITIQNVVNLAYSGATSARRNTSATVKATLTDPNLGTSVLPSRPVSFSLSGSGSVSGTTNTSGVATATLPVTGAARNATLTVSFAATPYYDAKQIQVPFTVLKNTSVTTVVSPSAVVHGEATAFIANVARGEGTGDPSGTVQFKVDGANFGAPVAIIGGSAASGATSSLSTGNHTVTAVYSGDADFEGSTSAGATQTVNKAETTTSLTSTGSPTVSGQTVTFTATVGVVAPGVGQPGGAVQFNVDGQPYGTAVPLSGDTATLSIANLDPGNHDVEATYNGNADFAASSSATITHGVDQAATDLQLTTSNPSALTGEGLTFTATVTPVGPGAGTPTGDVQFAVDGDPLGAPVALNAGTAVSPVAHLLVGEHEVTANYLGSVKFAGSQSSIDQDVAQGATTTSISLNPNPSVVGQPVAFEATVEPVGPAGGSVGGTIQWFVDGTAFGQPVAVNDGESAELSVDSLERGTHVVRAEYSGDSEFTPSHSGNVTQTVNRAASKTVVTTSGSPSVWGQPVTYTAKVTAVAPGAGQPSGVVTFTDGSTVIGIEAVAAGTGGQASVTVDDLGIGQHAITASYEGNNSFLGSTGLITQKVQRAQTSMAVTSSANPAQAGQGVKFTATLAPVAPGAGEVTGTVTFTVNGAALGAPVAVVNGSATSPAYTSLSPGTYKVAATYSGDAHFVGTSGVLDQGLGQTVAKGQTSLDLQSDDLTADFGDVVTIDATVSAVAPATGRPTGVVQIWDGDVLRGAASLTPGNGNSSSASFALANLEPGAHALHAVYLGNFNFEGQTGDLTQMVGSAPTVTGLVATPATYGQDVTFTATVNKVLPGPGTLTGTVTFTEGSTVLGTAPLATVDGERQAVITVPGLGGGTHDVVATYSGDASFEGSASAVVTHQVARAESKLVLDNIIRELGDHGAEIKATLTGVGGQPLAGRTVVFTTTQPTDHSTIFICSATTDATGRAVCGETVLIPAQFLDVGFDGNFAGDADYLPAHDHNTYFYSGH